MRNHLSMRFTIALVSWSLLIGTASSQNKCSGLYKAAWTDCVGVVTTPKGQKYIGEFRDGKRTGKGAYIYPYGLNYEGNFVNGHYKGYGTLIQPDGSKYVGVFLNDKENGEGIEYGANGAVLRSGIWKDGAFVIAKSGVTPRTLPISSTLAEASGDNFPSQFADWISRSPNRTAEYADLEIFLDKHGVKNVLPTWQLLIPDEEASSEQCPIDTYVIPPRKLWPNVVPTLRVIRSEVTPVVGPVRIVSGYRPPEFNQCVGGAKKSVHMTFSAFDVIPIEYGDAETVFQKMCHSWAATPMATKFGFGAYFDPRESNTSAKARFHVDTHSRRTWGYDYTARSSYCVRLPG